MLHLIDTRQGSVNQFSYSTGNCKDEMLLLRFSGGWCILQLVLPTLAISRCGFAE